MLNDQRALVTSTTTTATHGSDLRQYLNAQEDDLNLEHDRSAPVRDIHALIPPPAAPLPRPPAANRYSQSPSLSTASSVTDNFSTMSREFNALVLAGSAGRADGGATNGLDALHEEVEEATPLPDGNPLAGHTQDRVRRQEVETRISAWQSAKISKINNRFKREDAVISGWEGEKVQKANSRMKKVERKLEEKRAKALEKMQNDIVKAHRGAEERRASVEAKRGFKVARVLEVANLIRAVGRAPVKRSFF